ncbi:hypothetical protein CH368_16010, partial [Leptospira levettii]
ASGKVTGEDVYGKKSSDFGIDKDLMKYASGRGENIASLVTGIETIKKNTDASGSGSLSKVMSSVKGYANASGYTNLREIEFLNKMSSLSESRMVGSGAKFNMGDFGQFSAGLNSSSMNASRRMALSEKLGDSAFQGPFSGDPLGQMAFIQSMSQNKGNLSSAIADLEANPMKYMSQGIGSLQGSLGKDAFGLMFKMTGMGSFTEGSSLSSTMKSVKPSDIGSVKAGWNDITAQTNTLDEVYEEKGKSAFDLRNKYQRGKAGIVSSLGGGAGEMLLDAVQSTEQAIGQLGAGAGKVAQVLIEAAQGVGEAMGKFFGGKNTGNVTNPRGGVRNYGSVRGGKMKK